MSKEEITEYLMADMQSDHIVSVDALRKFSERLAPLLIQNNLTLTVRMDESNLQDLRQTITQALADGLSN